MTMMKLIKLKETSRNLSKKLTDPGSGSWLGAPVIDAGTDGDVVVWNSPNDYN